MKNKTLDQFYEYFSKLFELQALSTQIKQNVLMEPNERAAVKARVDFLNKNLKEFRDSVINDLRNAHTISRNARDATKNWHCLRKACKNKFQAPGVNYLKLLPKCPKCGSNAIELLS